MKTRRNHAFRYLLLALLVFLASLHGWQARAQDEPTLCVTQREQMASLQPLLEAHNATRMYAVAAPGRLSLACGPERKTND